MANEVEIVVSGQNRAGSAMSSATQQADQLGRSTKRVGDIAAGIIASQVFTRIADAAKRAFTSTISASVDLNESINATNVVFGDAATDVLDIGKNASQSMGLSKQAFNAAAVQFSAFAKTIAGEGGDVSGVVQDITGRASDFASVMNLDVQEALGLFQSGLAGETEPLRRYGIDVSAASVQTFAWANGIAQAGQELTEQQKVQARYGSIMQQTSLMQGDFANTSDELANATRRAQAEVENTQASMGQNLLPVLAIGADLLSDVLLGFQALPGPVQTAAGLIVAAGTAAAAAAVGLRALGISLTAVKAALGPIGIVAAVMGAALAGLAALGKSSQGASAGQEELRGTLDETTGAITDNTREFVANRIVTEGLAEQARTLGIDLQTLTEAYLGNEDALARVRAVTEGARGETEVYGFTAQQTQERLTDEAKAAQRLGDDLDTQVGALEGAQRGQEDFAEATGGAGDAQADLEAEVDEVNAEIDAQQKLIDGLAESMFDLQNQVLGVRDAERGLEDAIDKATEAVEENGATLDRNTEEGRNNEAALDDIASAAHQLAEEQLDAGVAGDEMRGSMRRAREQFISTAEQMGLTRGQARKLADQLGLIPDEVETTAKLRDQATSKIDALQEKLNGLRDRTVTIFVQQRLSGSRLLTGGGAPLPFAHGGIVGAGSHAQEGGPRGRDVLIDEQRPEVVNLPDGSRVIPSLDQAFDRNQAGGGGGVVVLELHSGGSRLDDLLLEVLRRSIRVKGGDVQVVLGSG